MPDASSTAVHSAPAWMPELRRRGVVLGIGNSLLTDEAVGLHVVAALRDRPEAEGLDLIDGGTLSFTLLEYVEAVPALVIVDAGELDAPAGTVRCHEGAAMDEFLSGARQRTVHEVGLLDLLSIARLHDALPVRRALVCIQPAQVGWGLEPTAEVRQAIPQAVEQVVDVIRRWRP